MFALQSCVKTDDYATPDITCTDKFPATNHTLTDLSALGKTAPTPADVIQQDFIVEGYVSSNDESGNIYKTLYVQDAPSNPTQAIEIDIDAGSLYTKFPLGSKVRINAKGLIVQKTAGNVKLGSYDPSYPVGRINPNALPNYMARVCGNDGYPVVAQMIPVEFNSFSEAQKPENINKLVKIKNVQFKDDALGTVAVPNNFTDSNPAPSSGITERGLMDQIGGGMVIRNSVYANFANTPMRPKYAGSGSVTMILSLYSTSTWQGYIRDTNDLQLNENRFNLTVINFENFAASATDLTPYSNISVTGTKKWTVTTFNNNKYIQISGLNAGLVKTQFAVPVTFNGLNKLSFQTNAGYYNGDVLKVYWSLNYNPANPTAATLNDITSLFDISKGLQPPVGTGANYEASFRNSGLKNLPAAATGAGYLIFEYNSNSAGTPAVTSVMQLDNINLL